MTILQVLGVLAICATAFNLAVMQGKTLNALASTAAGVLGWWLGSSL